VTTLPRALGVSAVLALLVPVAACSGSVSVGGPPEIDQQALEADLLAGISGEDADQVEVSCEGPLVAEVDASTDCFAEFTVDGSRTGIRPTVITAEGEDVEYDAVVFIDGDSVAGVVQQQLRAQAEPASEVECGELLGERAATGECTVTDRAGETPVVTTVTEVNGLRVDFEFEPA